MLQFLVRRLLPRILTVARKVLPRCRGVFVIGFPPTEGNAVETVRALVARYDGTIWWAQAPGEDYLRSVGIAGQARIRPVAKTSPVSLLRYACAELVLFTHGVYGEPAALAAKPTVNLWHGAGMKRSEALFPQRTLRSRPSDVIVAPNALWGRRCAELSGLDDAELLLVGYPRNDQLFRPASHEQLARLGLTGEFVVWLPTYRTVRPHGTMTALHDSADAETDRLLAERFAAVVAILVEHGVQVAVKAHPLDAIARSVDGTIVLDDAGLEDAGVPTYAVLGAARGLISDSSSAWADYLVLDRPIGFFFPDRDAYRDGRGVFPDDVLDWLPGPLLDDDTAVREFARSLTAETTAQHERRRAAIERAGVVITRSAAHDLLDELRRRFPHLARHISIHDHESAGSA